MMMLDEILKKINSDLLTESVVSELKAEFTSAVNEEAEDRGRPQKSCQCIATYSGLFKERTKYRR